MGGAVAIYEIRLVVWEDSVSHGPDTWVGISDIRKELADPRTLLHRTAGFVIAEDDRSITIASSVSDSEEWASGTITIPKCAIIRGRGLNGDPEPDNE